MILKHVDSSDYFLDLELRRDMALPPESFARMMRWMFAISLGGGTLLFMVGAWPVIGFLGLDALLVWAAFRLYHRSQARQYERVRIDRDALIIEQHASRCVRELRYEPTFLNILPHADDLGRPIHICQRGQCAEIGRWLGAEERTEFAKQLKAALRQRQQALVHG